ncbi:Protein vav [Cryptotermes secundus]|uniref:Protein vav n=1 Tax=Cryptotermes secundus TaxID=105785 RepID=A0A2J7QV78_9NEOP|nr:protein vav isoform X2 [Cryptotermes secundus]PNF32490.1 Protein vav [Cryptotermes secundus]
MVNSVGNLRIMASGSESWKECSDWLTRCDVLRQDHKANWPEASCSDLAYTLRDGVLLCNLLNTLDPGCIDMKDINQKPQMAQFLCLRNIKIFLQACHEIFGLKQSDLFEPSMLFDLTDFYRVLNTLSKLSNCEKVQKKKIPGFSVLKNRSTSQEDIYRSLNSNDDEPSNTVMETEEYGSYYSSIHNEEVYQDLCAMGRRAEPQITSTIAHSFEKRDYVIKELVETEKNYVDVLSTLLRCFMRPLNNLLREEDMKVIFGGIKELSEIHAGFHSQLRKAVAPGSTTRLSEVFLNWREKFLIYGDYCANLTYAQALVQDVCNRNQIVNQEVIRCQQDANNGKFKLRDILSVPMQRILKYHLLLDKLISETLPNHEDYRGLERAKEAMVDVAQYINDVKRDSDTLQIMRSIQESIIDWDMPENTELKDYGRLLKDGELRIKAHDDQKIKVRYVFIFDQVMLMCKSVRGDQYSYRESLRLSEYKVEDNSNRRVMTKDTRWSFQWFLVRKSERTAYTMYARTDELKRKWIKAIQEALDNIEPSGCKKTDHKFVMHTFDKPTTCSHCSKFLKGTIFQGYRCDKCSIASHKTCIQYSGRCGQPPIPPPRPHQRPAPSPPDPWPDPIFGKYVWFVGEMGREKATDLLDKHANGTYLLRIRPQGPTHPNETVYALSLKTDDRVKHMKVYEKHMGGVPQYYLSESRFFKSIMELIAYYEQASLSENFVGLDVKLKWPFSQIIAVAEFDFNPAENNQLPLRKGCQVTVLSKDGVYNGWWKGKIQDRVGFFPKEYVREISDSYNFHMD